MSDFLAYVQIGAGGSWGRAPTEAEALKNCAQSIRDWKSLFDVLGKEVEVGVYDVDGHDQLVMGSLGVRGSETNEMIPMLRTAKVRVPTDEDLEAEALAKAQTLATPEQVVKAYREDYEIGYETALARLKQFGLTERKADDMLIPV